MRSRTRLDVDSTEQSIQVGRRTVSAAAAVASFFASVAETTKMGNARCLLFILATLATCFAGSSEVRMRRSTPWRMITVLDVPYVNSKFDEPTKNEDYEGYIPDLLQKIGQQLQKPYIITTAEDNEYGEKDRYMHRWIGLIGAVLDNKADVAAAAITISEARKAVVDFTDPLMSGGTVIILKKPSNGSVPWIKSAKELADHTDIAVGVLNFHTTLQLIKNSTRPYFQKMYRAFEADPDLVIPTNDEALRRVRSEGGRFAFITESAAGEYYANRKPCDLYLIETELSAVMCSFAVAKDSLIKARLNAAISQLRDIGEMQKIRQKWWKEECSSADRHSWGALLVLPLLALGQLVAASERLD